MFTRYEVCTPLNDKVIKLSLLKTGRLKNTPTRLPGFVPSHSDEIAPLMPISNSAESSCSPPERVELTMNSKKETNGRVKMGQLSKWAKSQNGPMVKMGCCCLPPKRVELTVNNKKETNGRIKMGQGSRWAPVVYPLKESN